MVNHIKMRLMLKVVTVIFQDSYHQLYLAVRKLGAELPMRKTSSSSKLPAALSGVLSGAAKFHSLPSTRSRLNEDDDQAPIWVRSTPSPPHGKDLTL